MLQKLPIGIQSFEEMRTGNWYYVDKTQYVKKLVDSGKYFFLSRPRRFGKSLFLDTLRQAFFGRKELFNDLYLERNWDWNARHPVVHISFGSGVHRSLDELQMTIDSILIDVQKEFGISYSKKSQKDKFAEAVKEIYRMNNAKVVVLIDEYDKPILDVLNDRKTAIELREELKNFYSVLKDLDQYLKFVFITGVSKFSKVSIFSGLNQLQDISLNPEYATVCGYTQEELEKTFADCLESVNVPIIREWYDGYNFLGESVYNPFDVLLHLSEGIFRAYWFESGTPSFLVKLLGEGKYYLPKLEDLTVSESLLGSFDVEMIYPETVLFQTGYLTIRQQFVDDGKITYKLGLPNKEVRISINDHLLNYLASDYLKKEEIGIMLRDAVRSSDFEKLKGIFHSFFASIPSEWYRKNQVAGYEGYYASIVYAYFCASGFEVKVEDATNAGRIDMAVISSGKALIFEFKVVEYLPEGCALEQIRQKRYWDKYSSYIKDIYILGVEFSKEKKNIVAFEWERV